MSSLIASQLNRLARVPLRVKLASFFGVALFVVLSNLLFPAAYKSLDRYLDALAWGLLSEQKSVSSPIIVSIDEKSLSELGAWPWDRSTIAELSEQLKAYGTKNQVFDVVFPESKPGDRRLGTSLEANDAIIGQLPFANGEEATRKGELTHALSYLDCGFATSPAFGFLGNASELAEVKKGHITPVLETNGAIHRIPGLLCVDGLVYPALSLVALFEDFGQDISVEIQTGQGLLAPAYHLSLQSLSGREMLIPLDKNGQIRVDYSLLPGSYSRFSAADILARRIPEARLENRTVIVGATAFGLGDVVPTPFAAAAPGVEIQARLLGSFLEGRVPYDPDNRELILILLGFVTTLVLLLSGRGSRALNPVLRYPILAVVVPLAVFGMKLSLLSLYGAVISISSVVVFAVLASLVAAAIEHYLTREGSQRLLENFTAYLPAGVAEQIGFDAPKGYVQAERQSRVLLNADLRNFTAFEDARPPEETAALLHLFLVEATAIAARSGGVLEELKGDSIIISWDLEHCDSVLGAARDLHGRITSLLQAYEASEKAPMAIGIGVEAGSVFVGSLGPESRRVHTVLGEAVSRVVRIQEMTEELAQPILVGSEFADLLGHDGLELEGSFLLPGLAKSRRIYSLSSKISDSWEQLDTHLRLVRNYKS